MGESGRLTVAELMTREVVTLAAHEDLDLAGIIMRLGQIRHLPVVDVEGKLRGLLSHRDLLRASISEVSDVSSGDAQALLEVVPVAQVMRTNVTTVRAETPLREAGRLLLERKYGCLPVVDDDERLVGIVTESDFVRLAIGLLGEVEGLVGLPGLPGRREGGVSG